MAFYLQELTSKNETMEEQSNIRAMLLRDYPGLFEKTEQNVDGVMTARMKNDRDLALNAAIAKVIDRREGSDKAYSDDDIAIEVAEAYRQFLENPNALLADISSRAR